MQVYSRVYDSYPQAQKVVRELESSGIPSADISLVANRAVTDQYGDQYATTTGEGAASGAASGAGLGAAVGGTAGLLTGLGVLAIPGLGPVVAAGWLAATAVGALAGGASGGLLGALVGAGTADTDAEVYSEAVRRGGTLVSVRTEVSNNSIVAIMDRHNPISAAARRDEYEAGGWTGSDPKAPNYTLTEADIERSRRMHD